MIRLLLSLYLLSLPAAAAASRACPGSLPVGSFRLRVAPGEGGAPLPVRGVNALKEGYKLRYEPVKLPPDTDEKAQVAVVLVPSGDRGSAELVFFDPVKAAEAAAWTLPKSVSVVALLFGPQGLSVRKVKSLVDKNQEVLAELADYAEQNSKVEGLIEALTISEQTGSNLDAALTGFSSRYGVAMPKLDGKAATDQQARVLLQALLPSVNTYDPLAPKQTVMAQSAGLAASVAGMFFGSPVGIAAGGASLVQNMRTLMFPGMEFRSAFAQLSGDGLDLCAKRQPAKARTRMAYLWAHRVPELTPPQVSLAGEVHAPVGGKSLVRVKAEGNLRALERAREWLLTPAAGGDPVAVPVSVQAASSALELDLAKVRPAPGEYRLSARWDWDVVPVGGSLALHPFGDLKAAAVTPATRGRLAEGNGTVTVALEGADFQFVEKVAVERAEGRNPQPAEVHFTLSKGKRAGEQRAMEVEIEVKARGPHRLLLAQGDGLTYEVPFTVLPPNPKLAKLPLRPNAGEAEQPLALEGSGLERVEKLITEAGEFDLGAPGGTRRPAVFRLASAAKRGDRFPLRMQVQGIEEPLEVPGAIEVAGPRPRIAAARKSLGQEHGVALRPEEVPAGAPASFALSLQNLEGTPRVEVSCAGGKELRNGLALGPGDRTGGASLDVAGEGMLFLSLDPGSVGQPGCRLTASVATAAAGASDPYPLGTVVRVPRIERFVLTDEKLRDGVYAGTLQGYDLETIEKTGWDAESGLPVEAIPTPAPGEARKQVLRIALSWPAPAPRAPVYVWLRGEAQGRATGARY